MAIDEHHLARLASDLADSQEAILLHGGLNLTEQVMTEAKRPPLAHQSHRLSVLIAQTIGLAPALGNLDGLTAEQGQHFLATSTRAFPRLVRTCESDATVVRKSPTEERPRPEFLVV